MANCPICGKEIRYLSEHNLFYCDVCNKYYYANTPPAQPTQCAKEEPKESTQYVKEEPKESTQYVKEESKESAQCVKEESKESTQCVKEESKESTQCVKENPEEPIKSENSEKNIFTPDSSSIDLKLRNHERLHSLDGLISYVKHSYGAIELHEDYVVFYKNQVGFRSAVHGRISTIISFSDIVSIRYKGSGWLLGYYAIYLKNIQRPLRFIVSNWFVWTNKSLNLKLRRVYNVIFNKVLLAKKNEKYHVIRSFENIKAIGYCPICGESITEDMAFCSKCGTRMGGK